MYHSSSPIVMSVLVRLCRGSCSAAVNSVRRGQQQQVFTDTPDTHQRLITVYKSLCAVFQGMYMPLDQHGLPETRHTVAAVFCPSQLQEARKAHAYATTSEIDPPVELMGDHHHRHHEKLPKE